MTTDVEKQARPHDELICELLDSRIPKTEREHAAAREIERLRARIEEMEQQEPVAKVHIHKTGGNVGNVWSAVACNDFDSLPLLDDGDLLYLAPGAQPELNLLDPTVQKRLATQWGYVQKSHPDCDEGCMFQCAQPAPELCPCCGEAMRIYSKCRNADCEAHVVTPEQSRYNKVLAFAKTVATRLNEHPAPSINPAALYPVISWLRNGCDPMKAADELEMLASPESKP